MNFKYVKKIVLSFIMVFVLFLLGNNLDVSASMIYEETIYEDIALNFFKNEYKEREIEYDSLSVFTSNNLYDYYDDVVAKVVVLNRDESYDYVILNIASASIDEFSFNDDSFNKDEKVYYTSPLNYYKEENNSLKHIYNNNKLSFNELKENSKIIHNAYQKLKSKAKSFTTDGNPLPVTSKSGYNGFYSWSEIRSFNTNNGYYNSDWGYLTGTNWLDKSGTSAIFTSQSDFNSYFGTDNACGPTALTNMFTWFDYMNIENNNGEVNALLNDSKYDTFDRLRTLVGHTNSSGTSRSNYNQALKDYANEQGYDYTLDTGVNTYDEFKSCIDDDMPVLTSISLDGWGGHAVVTVGYEKFTQEYEEEHSFLWFKWTTTEYRYTKYLRVVDGWSTSNNARYIDLSGYWDDIIGRGFKIY